MSADRPRSKTVRIAKGVSVKFTFDEAQQRIFVSWTPPGDLCLGGQAARPYRKARDSFLKSLPVPEGIERVIDIDVNEAPLDQRAAIEFALAKPGGTA